MNGFQYNTMIIVQKYVTTAEQTISKFLITTVRWTEYFQM